MPCTYEMCTLTMQCQALELAIYDHCTSQWNPTTKTTFTTWSRIQTWNRNEREAKKKGTTNSWATKRRWYLVKNLMFTTSTNGYVPHNNKKSHSSDFMNWKLYRVLDVASKLQILEQFEQKSRMWVILAADLCRAQDVDNDNLKLNKNQQNTTIADKENKT